MRNSKQKQKKRQETLNKVPIFLAKTYRIVDNPDYENIIEWTPDGKSFIIKDVPELTSTIFPKHFKHSNFASFVRQLNMYGFHKVRTQEDGQVFSQEYFLKDQVELLQFIRRKINSTEQQQQFSHNNQIVASIPMVPAISTRQKELEGQVGYLTEKLEGVQSLVSILVDQHKQIALQHKSFLSTIRKMDESYRKKIETLMFLMMMGIKNGDGNIIIPQQVHTMLKNMGKKKTKSSNPNSLEVFKKEGNRFNNKKIEQIFQILKNESQQPQNQVPENLHLSPQPEILSIDQDPLEQPPSSHLQLKSFPSHNENKQDLEDFLNHLDQSDILDFGNH